MSAVAVLPLNSRTYLPPVPRSRTAGTVARTPDRSSTYRSHFYDLDGSGHIYITDLYDPYDLYDLYGVYILMMSGGNRAV